MSDYESYRSGQGVPGETWTWNMYGAGIERIGRDGKPEKYPVPTPGPDQLLVRVDAVGMCFSDTKLIKQGGKHPKLYDRDLEKEPTVLGHEVALTVIAVGTQLGGKYHPGQRLALQPDIYDAAGRSTAFGYTIRGGLTQYLLLGPEVLDVNGQCFVLPIEGDLGYAEAALTEPWACVEGAYSQRRRLEPLAGGTMWIVGQPGDATPYRCTARLSASGTFVLTDVGAGLAGQVRAEAKRRGAKVLVKDGLRPADYGALRAECTGGAGFDDVIVLGPRAPEAVGEAARIVARRGTFNVVGAQALPGPVQVDVGRIHYDYIAWLGNPGPDAGASYGEARNRCELRGGGVALFVGAAGPMGQMHVQRALELDDGPRTVIGSDVNPGRLAAMIQSLGGLAEARGKRLLAVGPGEDLAAIVRRETGGRGADDVVVSVPVAEVMAQAATHMAVDGMLVFFAGVPNGTYAPLDLGKVYLHGAQYTGTSGSAISDQALVIEKALGKRLSPARSVGAVGGMEAAVEGVRAMLDGRFAGKVIIFPQVEGLPLTGLDELARREPAVAEKLGPGGVWTSAAERALLERYWKP
jgi:threonine dehydrogenase-like Zn-dependent dehydrogenase